MGRLKFLLRVGVVTICVLSQPASVFAQTSKASPAHPKGNPGDWFPRSSMPAESVVRGQVGAVIIQFDLDADGAITTCRVVESSSYPLLDTAACDRAKRVGKFAPALDENGNAVASTYTLPRLRYVLSGEKLSTVKVDDKRMVYNSTIQIDVDRSGNIAACRSLNTDMSDKSACAAYVIGQPAPSALKASKGSRATISNTVVVDENDDR